jgi:hypothetical protein
MRERDDLAALIHAVTDPHSSWSVEPDGDDFDLADAILERWRLMPREAARHAPTWTPDRSRVYCELCEGDWPCLDYLTSRVDSVNVDGVSNAPK